MKATRSWSRWWVSKATRSSCPAAPSCATRNKSRNKNSKPQITPITLISSRNWRNSRLFQIYRLDRRFQLVFPLHRFLEFLIDEFHSALFLREGFLEAIVSRLLILLHFL